MLTLTTPIAVPQVVAIRVVRVAPDIDDLAAYIFVQVRSGGGLSYPFAGMIYTLAVRDGLLQAQGLRATVAPASYNDRVEIFSSPTAATAFTDVVAANVGATVAIRNKAVESALLAAGLLPAGVVA